MSIIIKGCVTVSHTHTGNNGKFEYKIEDLGYTEEEFLAMTDKEKDRFLDEVLDTEVGNVLDCDIGWEQV